MNIPVFSSTRLACLCFAWPSLSVVSTIDTDGTPVIVRRDAEGSKNRAMSSPPIGLSGNQPVGHKETAKLAQTQPEAKLCPYFLQQFCNSTCSHLQFRFVLLY
jgi:hypothetical protein